MNRVVWGIGILKGSDFWNSHLFARSENLFPLGLCARVLCWIFYWEHSIRAFPEACRSLVRPDSPRGSAAEVSCREFAMVGRLNLVEGDARPDMIEVTPDRPISIGRSRDNNIVIPRDELTSRLHAKVYYKNGQWYVQDFGLNGTRVTIRAHGSYCRNRPRSRDTDRRCTVSLLLAGFGQNIVRKAQDLGRHDPQFGLRHPLNNAPRTRRIVDSLSVHGSVGRCPQ